MVYSSIISSLFLDFWASNGRCQLPCVLALLRMSFLGICMVALRCLPASRTQQKHFTWSMTRSSYKACLIDIFQSLSLLPPSQLLFLSSVVFVKGVYSPRFCSSCTLMTSLLPSAILVLAASGIPCMLEHCVMQMTWFSGHRHLMH